MKEKSMISAFGVARLDSVAARRSAMPGSQIQSFGCNKLCVFLFFVVLTQSSFFVLVGALFREKTIQIQPAKADFPRKVKK